VIIAKHPKMLFGKLRIHQIKFFSFRGSLHYSLSIPDWLKVKGTKGGRGIEGRKE